MKLGLKEEKLGTLSNSTCRKLRLEEEYNYNILLQMTSENFEEIFQLIKTKYPKRTLTREN